MDSAPGLVEIEGRHPPRPPVTVEEALVDGREGNNADRDKFDQPAAKAEAAVGMLLLLDMRRRRARVLSRQGGGGMHSGHEHKTFFFLVRH